MSSMRTSIAIFGDSDDEARRLLYVPTGPTDPLIDTSLLTQAEIDQLFATINSSGLGMYAGGFAPRNEFKDPWFKDMDIRFTQDIPVSSEATGSRCSSILRTSST